MRWLVHALALGLWLAVAPAAAEADLTWSTSTAQQPSELGAEEAAAALSADAVRLPATAAGQRHWLQVGSGNAAAAVLRVDRIAATSLQLWVEGEPAPRTPTTSPLAAAWYLPLPAAKRSWLVLSNAQPLQFSLQFIDSSSARQQMGRAAALAGAGYAALASVLLLSLALTLGLRDLAFRRLNYFLFGLGLFLLAHSGHLFDLPGLAGLRRWPQGLPWAAGLWMVGCGLRWSAVVLFDAGDGAGGKRGTDLAGWAVIALGVLTIMLPAAQVGALADVFAALILTGLLAAMLLAAWSWSLGGRLADAICALWGLLALALLPPLGRAAGWWSGGFWASEAYLLAAAAVGVGACVALTERTARLRRQAEESQALHQESRASLQLEQLRRRFQEALRELAKATTAEGDLEWKALRLLLQYAAETVPARSLSVTATGYRGFDYLLTEPMTAKAQICALLSERSATLKGICRSRKPVQVSLDLPGSAGSTTAVKVAVVPLAIARPGWGALLLHRPNEEDFAADELETLADLAGMAIEVIDEGAEKAELKREAELDPLTGLLSKRAGDVRLDALLRNAHAGKTPLCLLFVDFDLFRPLNEKHGVAAGDACLRAVAEALRPLLGRENVMFRQGGDEFIAIVPGQTAEQVRELAERMRAEVAGLRVQVGQATIKLTVSIGIADRGPAEEPTQRIIDRAERAAGAAKGGGRNRIKVSEGLTPGQGPDRPLIL